MMDFHRAGVALLGAKGTSPSLVVANWWMWSGDRRAMKPGIAAASATSSCMCAMLSQTITNPLVESLTALPQAGSADRPQTVQMGSLDASHIPESARGNICMPFLPEA